MAKKGTATCMKKNKKPVYIYFVSMETEEYQHEFEADDYSTYDETAEFFLDGETVGSFRKWKSIVRGQKLEDLPLV